MIDVLFTVNQMRDGWYHLFYFTESQHRYCIKAERPHVVRNHFEFLYPLARYKEPGAYIEEVKQHLAHRRAQKLSEMIVKLPLRKDTEPLG